MKKINQSFFSILFFSVVLVFSYLTPSISLAKTDQTLSFQDVIKHHGVIIDTRASYFYNGWPQNGLSGHEIGAKNLSASWLLLMDEKALNKWLDFYGIQKQNLIALYGSDDEVARVKEKLIKTGFSKVVRLQDALQKQERLLRLANYQQLVYPQWLYALQHGKNISSKPSGDWKLFEVGWGEPSDYLQSHIPGAKYINTLEIEEEPLWNKKSDQALTQFLEKNGIASDTTVILYGRKTFAAARVAQILLYLGVSDVRILDGGFPLWQNQKLSIESGVNNTPVLPKAFGKNIPSQHALIVSMEEVQQLVDDPNSSIVSVRSWPEYTGEISGYNYIKAKGEIKNAKWGHAGTDKNGMENFHNPDGTMRSYEDISNFWKMWNILPTQQVIFYCGTGWRASEAFIYARAMGWPNIAVYDGGWYEWSSYPNNPISIGDRKSL